MSSQLPWSAHALLTTVMHPQAESRFLSVMLPSYLVHLQRYPATLIVKFVGSYSVKVRQSCHISLLHAPGTLSPLLIFPSDVWAQDLLYCHDECLSLGVAACTRCVRLEGGGVLLCVRSVVSTATRSSKAVLAGLLCEPQRVKAQARPGRHLSSLQVKLSSTLCGTHIYTYTNS